MEKELAKKELNGILPNIIFYGLGALIIAFVKNNLGWENVAYTLGAIYVILVLISLLRTAILIGTTSILFFSKSIALPDKRWDILVVIISITEDLFLIIYSIYILNAFKMISLWP